MDVRVREASVADVSTILSIYKDAGVGRVAVSLDRATAIFDKMRRYPNYKVFVAEGAGQIVGTFALLIMDNLAGAPSGVVEDVAVQQSFQRKGIGKAMMKFAFEVCRVNGCYKMTLSSNTKRTEAHQFYESLGFVRHGYSFALEPGAQAGLPA